MSQTRAHPTQEKQKDRGKEVNPATPHTETVPAPADGSHAQSHAAHLHTDGDVHVEAAGNKHKQVEPGALRQPASIAQRDGKQHR